MLRQVTRHGIPEYGEKLGKGFGEERFADNEGVRLIIDVLEKDDERPIWFGLWGGCNTLAQAIWQMWKSKPPLFVKREKYPIWTDTVDAYTGKNGKIIKNSACTVYRWREAFQNDFAARMAWTDTADYKKTAHPPVVQIDVPSEITVKSGETFTLSAEDSLDPDGGELKYHWFNYPEAGTA